MAEFSQASIESVAGPEWTCQQRGNAGNFQLSMTRLVNRQGGSMTDDEKLDLLVQTREKLRKAGYNVVARLSQRDQNGRWTSWPHLWVNREGFQPRSQNQELSQLRQELGELKQLLAGLADATRPQANAPDAESEAEAGSEASQEDVPF